MLNSDSDSSFSNISSSSEYSEYEDEYDIKENETCGKYCRRISQYINTTVKTHKCHIYIVNKQYKIAARNKYVARFLCYKEQDKKFKQEEDVKFGKFLTAVVDKMQDSQQYNKAINDLCNGDSSLLSSKLRERFNNNRRTKNNNTIFTSMNIVDTGEVCISKERIMYFKN